METAFKNFRSEMGSPGFSFDGDARGVLRQSGFVSRFSGGMGTKLCRYSLRPMAVASTVSLRPAGACGSVAHRAILQLIGRSIGVTSGRLDL